MKRNSNKDDYGADEFKMELVNKFGNNGRIQLETPFESAKVEPYGDVIIKRPYTADVKKGPRARVCPGP